MFCVRAGNKWSTLAATLALPAALLLAPTAAADPNSAEQPVVDVAPTPQDLAELDAAVIDDAGLPAGSPVTRAVVHRDVHPRRLPPGVCAEQGLQVKTILLGRAVSAAFPEIHEASGVRPDAKPWHPSGRAIDFIIPNPGSAEGIALGDAILDFALRNAERFAVQDVIWRGTYYTPGNGPSGSGYGHYDHVHVTTFGGGYPTGGEDYLG